MNLLKPVANDHLRTLEQLLSQHNLINLEQLHGFLTATATSPKPPSVNEWLHYAQAESIEPKDKEALQDAMEKVLQDITHQLSREALDFLELEDEQKRSDVFDEIKLWAKGYMDVVTTYNKTWLSDTRADELLHPLHLLYMTDEELKNLMGQGGYAPNNNLVSPDNLRDYSARMLSFNVYELYDFWTHEMQQNEIKH